MKKRLRSTSIQFYVDASENKKIRANFHRSGMKNFSDFLRMLAMYAKVRLAVEVSVPQMLDVVDAQLGVKEGKVMKRAAGQ